MMLRLFSMLNLQKAAETATDINFESMTDILPVAGEGWLGVFVAILVIVAIVYVLNAVTGKK